MPDPILAKLASSMKIKTAEDLLEAVSDWGYASNYCHEVLALLKGADHQHQLESQAQRTRTRLLKKKHKIEDLERDDEQQDGSTPPVLSTTPLFSTHTWIIELTIIKHIEQPARTWPSQLQPQKSLLSYPYTCTDILTA